MINNNNTRINRNYMANPIIQQSNHIRTNNSGAYEPISGQSYPRPVSTVTGTTNNSNSDVYKICKCFT